MNKYSMVGINSRLDDEDNLLVRRVLISYDRKSVKRIGGDTEITYVGTRIIEKDEYFKDQTKSHQYDFFDDGYVLRSVSNQWKDSVLCAALINSKRPYHYWDGGMPKGMEPIEFEASSDGEAIAKFVAREEKR